MIGILWALSRTALMAASWWLPRRGEGQIGEVCLSNCNQERTHRLFGRIEDGFENLNTIAKDGFEGLGLIWNSCIDRRFKLKEMKKKRLIWWIWWSPHGQRRSRQSGTEFTETWLGAFHAKMAKVIKHGVEQGQIAVYNRMHAWCAQKRKEASDSEV